MTFGALLAIAVEFWVVAVLIHSWIAFVITRDRMVLTAVVILIASGGINTALMVWTLTQ